MNTRLSTPSTISRADRATNANRDENVNNSLMTDSSVEVVGDDDSTR